MELLLFIYALLGSISLWILIEAWRRQSLRFARGALYRHDVEKALKCTRLALRLPFLHPAGRTVISRFHAQLLIQNGRYDDALRQIDIALTWIARRPARYWNQLALSLMNLRAACLEVAGRVEESERCRNATLEVWASMGDPSGSGTFEAALAEQSRGEYGLAMERMRVAIEKSANPLERATRWLHLAMMASEIGRFDQAIELGQNAIDDLPEPLKLLAYVGLVDWSLNEADFDLAEQNLMRALVLAEELNLPRLMTQAKLAQAEVMFARGQKHEAITRLEKLCANDEGQWTIAVTLAERLHWMGYLEEAAIIFQHAEKSMKNALNVTPDIRASMSLLAGQTHAELGNLELAWDWIMKAAALPIKRPRILVRVYSLAAIIACQRSDSESADHYFGLAEQTARNYQDAPIMRAHRSYLQGRWQLLHGNMQKAQEWLTKGIVDVRLRRDLPQFHYYLGEARRLDGNENGARQAYQAAADIGVEHLYAALARRRLNELPPHPQTQIEPPSFQPV